MSTQKLATYTLQAGNDVIINVSAKVVPIYQTSSYIFNGSDHAADLFSLKELSFIYTRLNNPTNLILQERLDTIEEEIGAIVFTYRTSAISADLLTLLKAGDHITASSSLHGDTYNLLSVTLSRLGITTIFVDASNPNSFANSVKDNTRTFFVKSLGNPKLDVLNLEAISAHAKKAEVPFIVNNTIATPTLVNLVIHYFTKYISKQDTCLSGSIIDNDTFNYANGKPLEFTELSIGYHNLVYHEVLDTIASTFKLILEGLRDFGRALSLTNVFNIIQSLETLLVRSQQHSKNALN